MTSPLKILHLRATDRVCGPGKTILQSCKHIDTERFQLRIGLLSGVPESENRYWITATEMGLQIDSVRGGSRFSVAQVRRIVEIVRQNDIDIIHSHEYKSDFLGLIAAKIARVRIVTTAHGWISNNMKSKVYLSIGKNLLRWFDHVIAVSPEIRNEVMRYGVNADRSSVIYNAIVVDDYNADKIERGYLRKKFRLPDHFKIIGNVGRISPEKGQADFVRAATLLLESHDDVCFVLVGDGPDTDKLRAHVKSKGVEDRILFSEYEHEIKQVYRDLDILALTSYSEGLPNVVLEALCMDVPVLATDVGGTAEIIGDSNTGILVDAGDTKAIAAGLDRLIQEPDLRRSLAQAGKARVYERFEFSRRMRMVEQVYLSLQTQ